MGPPQYPIWEEREHQLPQLGGKIGRSPRGNGDPSIFLGGEIGSLTGAPKRGVELGCPQTPSRAGRGPPKAPPRNPPVWVRGMPKPPQKPPKQLRGITGTPHTAQGYNGDTQHHSWPPTMQLKAYNGDHHHHSWPPTMQPKAYNRDLQTPPGNPHAAQGYNRDTPRPRNTPLWAWGTMGTPSPGDPPLCLWGAMEAPAAHPPSPVARPSAVARWRTVSSLTGHSGGSRLMASSPPSSASSAWIWGPEVQYSQRPPRYPSASPTPLSTMAAS